MHPPLLLPDDPPPSPVSAPPWLAFDEQPDVGAKTTTPSAAAAMNVSELVWWFPMAEGSRGGSVPRD
jgi:hypothetical protein